MGFCRSKARQLLLRALVATVAVFILLNVVLVLCFAPSSAFPAFMVRVPPKLLLEPFGESGPIASYIRFIDGYFANYSHCFNADTVLLSSGECYNTFGFRATLIESLEVLYLANLTLHFDRAKEALRAYSPHNCEWVNSHEYLSRVVASFIGTYLLSGDRLFLGLAERSMGAVLGVQRTTRFPPAIVNLRNATAKAPIFKNGTALSDVAAPLPELLSLYYLTGNITYLQAAERDLKQFSRRPPPAILSPHFRLSGTTLRGLNSLVVSFYQNIGIALKIHNSSLLASFIARMPPITDASYCSPLLDLGYTRLLNNWVQHHCPYTDGTGLRALLKAHNFAEIHSILSDTLSNISRLDYIPSAYMNQLLKFGILSHPQFAPYVSSWIFNDRGHLLFSNTTQQ